METEWCCGRCGYGGCDVRIADCGCSLHARCTPISDSVALSSCPICHRGAANGLQLLPMSFKELDEARNAAAALSVSGKRGKKRRSATIARLHPEGTATSADDSGTGGKEEIDLRTGRWTPEETRYCDKLIEKFQEGQIPIVEGVKLNDFLAKMLKSKQSRLTKKMKNAKLSTKTFKRTTGYIVNVADARCFSELEDSFFRSIQCSMERAEIRFHIQKEWRERFSSFCVQISHSLDAGAWLFSVEEMDRRMSQAKDAARMARRKLMMGYALSKDSKNPDQGVFIDRSGNTSDTGPTSSVPHESAADGKLGQHPQNGNIGGNLEPSTARAPPTLKPTMMQASPFLSKVIAFVRRQNFPFEHVDAWVPSFVPSDGSESNNEDPKCRLCYAGSATADVKLTQDGRASVPLSAEDQFHLFAFGEYSQKFSFDVGCGLPGRVYRSGVSSWEQNVQNAPHHHFERCGGAVQWGIKTVLGVPIPSPNVGRIVVVFYSLADRNKNQDIVTRICDGLTKFLPCPKWKLVVDVGNTGNEVARQKENESSGPLQGDSRVNEIVTLMGEYMPTDMTSPSSPFLAGFTSLRLMLLKPSKSAAEIDMLKSLLDSYSSYLATGRTRSDVALLLARDFMFLSQQQTHSNHSTAGGAVVAQQSPLQMLGTSGSPSHGVLQGAGLQATMPSIALQATGAQPNASVGQEPHQYSPHTHSEIPSITLR